MFTYLFILMILLFLTLFFILAIAGWARPLVRNQVVNFKKQNLERS